MTRRLFAGLMAAGGTAVAKTEVFISHGILRRPYKFVEQVGPAPYMLWDAVIASVSFGELKPGRFAESPLRVTVRQKDAEEAALSATVTPRHDETFMLLGVHQMRAESPATITFECRKKFFVKHLAVKFMHPPFRREGGMVYYHDPFYTPRPEIDVGYGALPHHRVIYGPGKDIGYLGSIG